MATEAEAVARVLAEPGAYEAVLQDLPMRGRPGSIALTDILAADRAAQRVAVLEEAARVVDRRIEERFREHGTTEWDTGATYYEGSAGEMYDALDEEAIEVAREIRAIAQPKEPAE